MVRKQYWLCGEQKKFIAKWEKREVNGPIVKREKAILDRQVLRYDRIFAYLP